MYRTNEQTDKQTKDVLRRVCWKGKCEKGDRGSISRVPVQKKAQKCAATLGKGSTG